MADFLEFGSTPEGAPLAPVKVDTDPRGLGPDQFMGLLEKDRQYKEDTEAYWDELAKENDFSKTNFLGKAVEQESALGNLFGMAEDYLQDYDPKFDVTPLIEDDWPTWRKEAVLDAKNARHAEILVNRTAEQDLYEKEAQYHGAMGTALQIGSAFLSPETYVLGIGEVAALTKLGLTGAGKIVAGATFGSLTNAGQEAVIVANNKSRDEMGIAVAGGFGAAFGAFGAIVTPSRKLDEMMGKDFSRAWANDMAIASGDVKLARPSYLSSDSQLWQDAVGRGDAAIDVDGSYVVQMGNSAMRYETKAQAVAAERLRAQNIELNPKTLQTQIDKDFHAEAEAAAKSVPKRKGGWWSSLGLAGRSSENPFIRKLFHMATEDASGTGGKSVKAPSAALQSDMYAMQMRSAWHPVRHQMGKEWAKDTGVNVPHWKPWDTSDMIKFDDEVFKEVGYRRSPDTRPDGYETHASIQQAADAYQNLQKMRFKRMKDSGVDGYDTMELDSLYQKHKWDGMAMNNIAKKYDKPFVVNLLKQAILNGGEFGRTSKYARLGDKLNDDFKERTATHMAAAIYNRFTRRPDTVNMARTGWLSKKDLKELRTRVDGIVDNPEDLKHIMNAADGKDSRALNEVLSQIDLDVNFRIEDVAVRDLLDTNLGASLDTDIRRSAGKSAMANMGFKNQDEFLEYAEAAGRWSRENLDMTAKQLERSNLQTQKVWNLVMGENLETAADSGLANFARAFRKQSTLASLNQVGFAQAAETGRLVGAIGVKSMMKQIPEFGRMIKRMKNGTFKDSMLNDIEAAFGIRLGDNEILNHPSLLADAGGVGITTKEATSWLQGMDNAMNKGLHMQGWLNGMNMIMKAQHRMHARGFFMNMHKDFAKKAIPANRLKRYADMGLSEKDLKTLKAEMDKHVEMGEGWLGQQRPTNFNLVKFSPEIREKVGLAFWRNQSQTIQRTQGGESAWWMESTFGKVLSQFRSFPLVAIEKQTLHDLKFADAESMLTLMSSLGFASLAYSAKTYMNSIGLDKKKRKQYLKNRLSPEKIAAGAVAWGGQFNIMPDLASIAGDFGFDSPFQYTYQKGQAYRDAGGKDLGLGAIGPAGALYGGLYKAATGLSNAAVNQKEFRNDTFKSMVRVSPFGNNLATKTLQNYFLEE